MTPWRTYLQEHRLVAVASSSSLAMALLIGRFLMTHHTTYRFLAWNLVLAWIPYAIAAVAMRWRHWCPLLVPGWLLFFPNAPYLITDFVHLRARSDAPLWYDIALLSSFAWAGLLLAVVSMRATREALRDWCGSWLAWVTVVVSCPVAGAGIYIGRFLRWNSWDLALDPRRVLSQVLHVFGDPIARPGPWAFSVIFGALLLTIYAAFDARGIHSATGAPVES